jgi:hypothetical protein
MEMSVEMFGDDELENRVAQKLEALVVEVRAVRLVPQTRMRECFREEQRVPEFVADAFFERIHVRAILPI